MPSETEETNYYIKGHYIVFPCKNLELYRDKLQDLGIGGEDKIGRRHGK